MDRVTSFSSYNSVITNLMTTESRLNQVNEQVSSGKVASNLEGFAGQAEALVAAQTLQIRNAGFIQANTQLSAKLSTQDQALSQVATAGQDARQAIAEAIASGSADGLMSTLQSNFGQAVEGLNTQYNGQYLFAGGQVDTPPVAAKSLADLTAPPPGGVFQNDQLATTSQIDASTTLQTGMLADGVGTNMFNAFQQVEAFDQGAGGPLTGQLTPAQINFLTGMLQTFDAANRGMTDTQATNGLTENRVTQATTAQQDQQTTLQNMVGNIADVDMAQASSQLSQAQVALQASAHVFASLQSTSLLNYLSSSGATIP
jgi:flagellar hook-associated protein 3 FlgL